MSILITGINGRIGKLVANGLLRKGFEVIGLDRASAIHSDLQSCTYIQADITKKKDLEDSLKGYNIDSVIHLAALAHFPANNIALEQFMRINYEGALNVVEVANKCGAKKVLFSSTVDVYGIIKGVVDENTVCRPVTNYGKSKYEAEEKLREYLAEVGIDYYIFRFSPVYTAEYSYDLDKRVLLPKGLGAFYFKDGSYKYSLCSVYNIVDTVIAFAEAKIEPDIYIVSDQLTLSVKEIVDIKKENGEVKYSIRMPYILIRTGIQMVSWLLGKIGIVEKGLLETNLDKLVNPVCYDSSKLASKVELKWNIKNTLYDNIQTSYNSDN